MTNNEIREKLKEYKDINRLSEYDLALYTKVSLYTINRFLKGNDIMPKTLDKISFFLNNKIKENGKCVYMTNDVFCPQAEEKIKSLNQMLMDAHFQNKKLADELVITQNQYNKVVVQNKAYNARNMELEKLFKWIKTQQYYILPKGFIKKIKEVMNEQV